MSIISRDPTRRFNGQLRLLGSAVLMICTPVSLWAQAATTPPASDSAMVNLVRLLVEQKVLSKAKGDALMAQAESEAANARQAALAAATPAPQQPSMPAVAEGTIRVPYVPESVRAQIRDELKQEVLAQAKAEGWAAPAEAAPEWTRRVKISGDLRVRSQSAFYARGNSNLIPDFARLNEIGPIPIFEKGTFIPLLNTTQDRPNRLLLRARLGIDAKVTPEIDVGFQLASGQTNSPISTNASLGGGFGKRDLWLQQAYIRAHTTDDMVVAKAGRFANPFFHSELHFDEDLAFDGVMLELNGGRLFGDGLTATVRGGAFPLNFGDPNFPQNDATKLKAPERWLFAGQVEVGGKITEDLSARVGVGYFSYKDMSASLSQPCFLYRVQVDFRRNVICSTDNEAAAFLQKGNTVIPIRDIVLNDPPPNLNEVRTSPQLVGLLFDYRILDINAEARVRLTDDIAVTVAGNYVQNLAFDRGQTCRLGVLSALYPPLNNVGSNGSGNVCDSADPSSFIGGNRGYLGSVTVGYPTLDHWGQWRFRAGYRYLESDAVLDAFTDSDFHLGGTNAKGYFVSAHSGLTHGTSIGVNWLSANEINGEPFANDVLQVELNAAF